MGEAYLIIRKGFIFGSHHDNLAKNLALGFFRHVKAGKYF
jgi:hypothetical protein